MTEKIFLRKKQFAEFVSLSLGKEVILLSWSAAAKVNLHLPIKTVQ